ncbi:hypothetical protein Ddc_08234 [Ditylenchus destructor]|nr:hypothetical protein Ddc_08234 [Ditylenchus destructor]
MRHLDNIAITAENMPVKYRLMACLCSGKFSRKCINVNFSQLNDQKRIYIKLICHHPVCLIFFDAYRPISKSFSTCFVDLTLITLTLWLKWLAGTGTSQGII